MPDVYIYVLIRASLTADYITADRARELYAEAESEPRSALIGSLEAGFSYWIIDTDSGLRLVRYHLIPLHAADILTLTDSDSHPEPEPDTDTGLDAR